MSQPYLHFSREEFLDRQARVRKALDEQNLDGLLLFRIEDMYWLTGLDNDGFYVFHCLFVGTEGALTYIARRVDRGNVFYSSIIEDYREWLDDLDTPRSKTIKDMLSSHGMAGKRIGLQRDSMGITAELYVELSATLDSWCELVPCSELVSDLRMVKSEAELAYLRKSGEITDKLCEVAMEETHSGVFEGKVFGRLLQTIYENDGESPGAKESMGCGDAAPLGRYVTGRKTVTKNDQFKFELGCGYRHYHTANLFLFSLGPMCTLPTVVCIKRRWRPFNKCRRRRVPATPWVICSRLIAAFSPSMSSRRAASFPVVTKWESAFPRPGWVGR